MPYKKQYCTGKKRMIELLIKGFSLTQESGGYRLIRRYKQDCARAINTGSFRRIGFFILQSWLHANRMFMRKAFAEGRLFKPIILISHIDHFCL